MELPNLYLSNSVYHGTRACIELARDVLDKANIYTYLEIASDPVELRVQVYIDC